MKRRIINSVLLVICVLFALVSCEIDNYPGPNATFSGGIRDVATGELVETDILNGSIIRAIELGWPSQQIQNWVVKNTGEFQNEWVFAARYNFNFVDCNFYPFTVENFEIKPGVNHHDFEVTPYIRVRDANIVHDQAGNRIVASFRLEGANADVTIRSIRLYAFTDIYVGEQVRFDLSGGGFMQEFAPGTAIDGSTVYTLSIDLSQNTARFQYSRNYYFRIGALAGVPNVGTVRHNYAPLVRIAL